ncbi:MAG: serine/threonine protein kinase, partial [Planctomycetes bacterium]|nr:serine/threonine protein kinase [Planctomycetota bacterium]
MQVGPYVLHSELGRGGMATVYRASDAAGEVVALKLLHLDLAGVPQSRQRFLREAQALTRLRHPGVVRLLDSGEHQGTPWLALEFVEGTSLQDRLRRGPLAVDEAVRLAQQMASALAYVHGCGVLHRDLKPDNVLLRRGQALLTDFGLALEEALEASRLTRTGAFVGTPGYWAPEQARGEKARIGPPSDVYGLGAVLYACLTGHAPVQASSIQEFLAKTEQVIPPPRAVRQDVPAWVSALCVRCLAQEPERRPSTDELLGLLGEGPEPPSRPGLAPFALGLAVALALGA